MQVILTEEVIGLGEPGKIVDVAPGYARNFLVPRKLAVYATSASARELQHHKARLDRKLQRMQLAAKSVAERINGQTLNIKARSGEAGKLYGSITTSDIAKALQEQFDVTVDRRKVALREPIRNLGVFNAEVTLLGDAQATININVFDPAHMPVEAAPAPVEAPAAAETVEEA